MKLAASTYSSMSASDYEALRMKTGSHTDSVHTRDLWNFGVGIIGNGWRAHSNPAVESPIARDFGAKICKMLEAAGQISAAARQLAIDMNNKVQRLSIEPL